MVWLSVSCRKCKIRHHFLVGEKKFSYENDEIFKKVSSCGKCRAEHVKTVKKLLIFVFLMFTLFETGMGR